MQATLATRVTFAPARPAAPPQRAAFTGAPLRQLPAAPRAACPRAAMRVAAVLTVTEGATGVEFPLVTRLWQGEELRCVGAGARVKKIVLIGVKVYAVALYVEAEKAARELGVRERGGFFETDDDYAQALVDGGFLRALSVELVRKVEGPQFTEALEEALVPRLRLTGDTGSLEIFKAFFADKTLEKGTSVTMLYRADGGLDLLLGSGALPGDLSATAPSLSIPSPGLTRALFENYLGASSVVPEARAAWVAGAKKLLESERVRRETRKGGSG